MERTPITEEILQDYEKSSQWMRTNIFLSEKRIQNKIGIGFIGTGGGAKIFDYLFREKSSRAILFAQMPYHQEAIYMENISYLSDFDNANLILVDNKFYKENYDEKNVVCDITPISAASEFIAEILCKSCHRKVTHIIENDQFAPFKSIKCPRSLNNRTVTRRKLTGPKYMRLLSCKYCPFMTSNIEGKKSLFPSCIRALYHKEAESSSSEHSSSSCDSPVTVVKSEFFSPPYISERIRYEEK
jgi:hypothetical protein